MHQFAAQDRPKLIEHVEQLAGPADGNRVAVLTLLRLADTPQKAQMLAEALETQDFLDADRDRNDRYAWDVTLHALRNWATLAALSGTESATHRIACALHHEVSLWLRISRNSLAGRHEDVAADRQSDLEADLPGLRARAAQIVDDADMKFAEELLDRVELALTGADQLTSKDTSAS
jgi:hypothetical protein